MIDNSQSIVGRVLDEIEARVGREGVIVLAIVAPLFASKIGDASWRPVVALWGIGLLMILIARSRDTEDLDDRQLREARAAYVEGDITLDLFEQQAELALDGEAGTIRDRLEEVGGIGPETSASLALEFDTLEDLERADRDELLAVYGIGPKTADRIESEVSA